VSTYPHYDYLADIQDSLMEFDEATAIDILILLGEELINTSCHGIVEKAFRCLGGSLPELIASLDGVYDVLKLQEEDLTDTGFVCASENELIFSSDRIAVAYLLLGSLQHLSKMLYKTECSIQMEPIEGSVQRFRFLFKIDDAEKVQPTIVPRSVSSNPSDLQMTNSTFCQMFPWHFIMDENLDLLQIGIAFSKLFKNNLHTTKAATHYFKFRRPVGLKLEFNEIIKRTNTPFLITLKAPVGRQDFVAKGLEIKGQMVFCPGPKNTLLFVGSPFLDGLEGLTCNGLFLSDIPLYGEFSSLQNSFN
jgi:guanylate cyclase soluble subunit alpha